MAEPLTETQAPISAPTRESILAQLDASPDEEATAAPSEAADEDSDDSEAAEADADEDSEAETTSDDDEDDDESTDEDEAPAEDPKTQKGLDAVRRAEKRHREQMTADRAEFAREQAKHAEKIAKLEGYEDAAKRVKYDPIALLKKLDVSEDDFELIAHAIFAESKAGAADPARKAAAANRLREREKEDKLTATQKEIENLKTQLQQDKIERENAAHAERYIGELNASAKAKFPLVAHMMKAAPEDTSDGLSAAFNRLQTKFGREPKPAEVVAEMDRKERTRLKAIGVDPDAVIKAKAVVTKAKTIAGAKPVNGNAVKPQTRDEIIAALDATT